MTSESKAGSLVTQLLENEVQVRCRASDDKLGEKCLAEAAKQYSKVVKDGTQCGASPSSQQPCRLAMLGQEGLGK